MHARLLDVLHNATDHNVFPVRKSVHVDLDRIFEEMVNQHWAILRIFDCLFHVANDRFLVVSNYHGATAEHIGRPNQHGITNSPGPLNCLFDRGRHRPGGLRDIQLLKQASKALPVLGKIDRLWRGANYVHAR